jgi:energy-coupling factor transporter ATP-binding protein EcfA2
MGASPLPVKTRRSNSILSKQTIETIEESVSSTKSKQQPKNAKGKNVEASEFLAFYGTGRKPENMSQARFMSSAAESAVNDLKRSGKFRRTVGGQLFYTMDKPTPFIAPLVDGDIRLQALINDKFGVNPASTNLFLHIIRAMQMEAHLRGQTIEVHQFCHANKKTKTVYVSLLDGKSMIKLDGDESCWELLKTVPNGTDGVYFLDDPSWEPWTPVIDAVFDEETGYERLEHPTGLARRLLVDPINFADTERLTKEEQKWLFEMWLRSLLLDLEEKPLLFLCGPPGSGKTVATQHVKKALFGQSGTVDMITKQDAFNAAVSSSPFLVLDNLDGFQSRWLIASLATASTGIAVQLRQLYTTNDVVSVLPRAWIALTSTDSLFADNQPAIADRMIVLNMERIGEGFGEKGQAEALILKHRNEILTDLVFQLHDYVSMWRNSIAKKTSLRVAAFGLAVSRFALMDGEPEKAEQIFQKLRRSQGDLLSEHNSLFIALDDWFARHPDNKVYKGTAGMIAQTVRETTNAQMSAVGMGRKLSELKPLLVEKYQMTHDEGKTGSKFYTFHRPADGPQREGDGHKLGDSSSASAPTVNLADAGGWDCLWVDG